MKRKSLILAALVLMTSMSAAAPAVGQVCPKPDPTPTPTPSPTPAPPKPPRPMPYPPLRGGDGQLFLGTLGGLGFAITIGKKVI